MRILQSTAVLLLLIVANTFAQKGGKESTGFGGKSDFEPSQTQGKNINEHVGGDKAPSNSNQEPTGSDANSNNNFNIPGGEPPIDGRGGEINNGAGPNVQPPNIGGQGGGPIIVPDGRGQQQPIQFPPPAQTRPDLLPHQPEPAFQLPTNVPNSPTVIKNGPQVVDQNGRPVSTHGVLVPLAPNEQIPVGQNPNQFPPALFPNHPTNFPPIADLDPLNTPPPAIGFRPVENVNNNNNRQLNNGSPQIEIPLVPQTGPTVNHKSNVNKELGQSKSSVEKGGPRSGESNLESETVATTLGAFNVSQTESKKSSDKSVFNPSSSKVGQQSGGAISPDSRESSAGNGDTTKLGPAGSAVLPQSPVTTKPAGEEDDESSDQNRDENEDVKRKTNFGASNFPRVTFAPATNFNPNNPSGRESLTKTDSSAEFHPTVTQNPNIFGSPHQQPKVVPLFANNSESSSNNNNQDGGVIFPNQASNNGREAFVTRGTLPPSLFGPNTGRGRGEPREDSRETSFGVEHPDLHSPTVRPVLVNVNSETLPPFVISGFDNNFPTTNQFDTNVHHVKPSQTHPRDQTSNFNPSGIVVSGNHTNALYNVSGPEVTNRIPDFQQNSGETFRPLIPFHNSDQTSTIHSDIVIPSGRGQLTPPPGGVESSSDRTPIGLPGLPPSSSASLDSNEKNATDELTRPGPPGLSNVPKSGEVTVDPSESSNIATQNPANLPIVPVILNTSSVVLPGGSGRPPSTRFPNPPEWTLPDDLNTEIPVVHLGRAGSNDSTVTGPTSSGNETIQIHPVEIFPPSINPKDITESYETSRNYEVEATTFHPFVIGSHQQEMTTQNNTLIVVHPAFQIPGEPKAEPEPNGTNWAANITVPGFHHLFEISTSTESSEEITEKESTESSNSSSNKVQPLFPILGNEVTRGNDKNATTQLFNGSFITAQMPDHTGSMEMQNQTQMEVTTMSNSIDNTNSSIFPNLLGSTSFVTGLTLPAENATAEPIGVSVSKYNLTSSPLSTLENGTAEPIPVGEWSRSTEESAPSAEPTKVGRFNESTPEPDLSTEPTEENSTESLAPPTKSPANLAVANWRLRLTDIDWDSSLNDKASWQYKSLYAKIVPELEQIFKGLLKERFVAITIKHFSAGSVVVNGQTESTEKIDDYQLQEDLIKELQKRDLLLGGHKVDPQSINAGGSAPQTGAKPVASGGVPGYVIGIIVAAVILLGVVLAVTLLIRRYKTRRLREDHYMVDEETMNGGTGAVKNWQQHNQQRQPVNGNTPGGRDNYSGVNMYEMKDNPNGQAHTNFGYQPPDSRANGHSAPARYNSNSNMAEIQLHNDDPLDEASTRH